MTRILALVSLFVLAGCGDDDGGMRDAGGDASRMDATVIDGGPISDAAGSDASPDALDSAMPMACRGTCDPIEGTCAGGVCVLESRFPACVETAGSRTEGEDCAGAGECAPGLACFLKREVGVCGRVCCPSDSDTCRTGERCGGPGVLVDGSATGFGECLPPRSCDVLGDECEPMEACYIVDPEGATDCREAGSAAVGAPCEQPNDCEAGLTCAGLFEATCVRICELGASGSCPTDEGMCIAYAQSPEGTGLCTPEMMARRR